MQGKAGVSKQKMNECKTVDPNWMQQNVASDLVLFAKTCVSQYFYRVFAVDVFCISVQ